MRSEKLARASWVGWHMPRETDGPSSVGWYMPRETDGLSSVGWYMPRETDGPSSVGRHFKESQWLAGGLAG